MFWIFGILIILLIAAYVVMLRVAPNAIPVDTPLIGKLTCPYPVKIAGNSMSPTFTAGAKVTFDRCSGDKSDLSIGTIIAFQEDGLVRISRITEKSAESPVVIYKTVQDGKPDSFIDVPADNIVATYQVSE